ncbi:MAG: AAA domain-containing protein [Metamycoplasmataceae bacterium]
MENKYLKHKLLNLIVFNNSDRAIFMKLNANEVLDPLNFFELNSLINLFEKWTNAHIKKNKWSNVISLLNEKKNAKDFLKKINEEKFFLPTMRKNRILKDFKNNKSDTITYLQKKYADTSLQLKNVNDIALSKEKDSGEWFFYLGRYFLKGVIGPTKEVINAPLLFVPVVYNIENEKLEIKEENFVINEKIITHLIKSYNKKSKIFQKWIDIDNVDDIILFLKKEFDIEIYKPNKIIDFSNSDVELVRKEYPKLVIEDSFVLGLVIPSGGRLKQDLNYIIENKIDVFGDNLINFKKEVDKNILFDPEKENIQITSLNLSQLKALKFSLESNTVIHGPPGTGKSETITNILANILINNKSALMVSEKNAALEVLIDRLGDLRDFSIFFNNINEANGKKYFFNSILTLEKMLSESEDDMQIDLDVDFKNEYFEKTLKNRITLKEINTLKKEITSWKNEDFYFNDYIKNLSYLNSKNDIYKKIVDNNIKDINKKEYQKIIKLINFMKSHTSSENEYKNYYKIMKRKIDIFLNEFFNLNDEWIHDNFSLFAINEFKNIQYSQKIIKQLFESNDKLENIFKNDLFFMKRNEEKINNLKIIVSNKDQRGEFFLDSIIRNNNYYEFLELVKNTNSLRVKKVVKKWLIEKSPEEEKEKMEHVFDYKIIQFIAEKIDEEKILLGPIVDIYNKFKSVLRPLYLFFYFKNLKFEEDVINFIENEWNNLPVEAIYAIDEFNIQFEEILMAKNIYNFKKYILTSERIEILQTYQNLKKQLVEDESVDWEDINKIIYNQVKAEWINKIKNSEYSEDIKEIFRIANFKRYPKLNPFIKKYTKQLMELFPIWIARPNDIANILECEEGIFDYGIFDEASQMFLERAYPILYRTKIKVVAGDEKQLKPSSFFVSRIEEQVEDEDDYIFEIDFNNADSLLERATFSEWNEILLNNHYRSVSQDLIEFSNKFIYDNKLNIASINQKFKSVPLEVIDVEGFFQDGINEIEAKEVIRQLELNIEYFQKIIIITFNISQSLYIKSLIDKNKNELVKIKNKEGNLLVTNLENVQGNEGDLVIISIAYAKSPKTYRLRNAYGPLNMSGGKNRLNVALTRSKEKMIIVKSFLNAEMDVNPDNENAMCFKNLIHYLDSKKEKNNTKKLISEETNQMKKEIYNILVENIYFNQDKIEIIIDYKLGNSLIDFVFYDRQKELVLLAIKINDWNKINDDFLEKTDLVKFLESRNYNYLEIDEIDWFLDLNEILNYINKVLN